MKFNPLTLEETIMSTTRKLIVRDNITAKEDCYYYSLADKDCLCQNQRNKGPLVRGRSNPACDMDLPKGDCPLEVLSIDSQEYLALEE